MNKLNKVLFKKALYSNSAFGHKAAFMALIIGLLLTPAGALWAATKPTVQADRATVVSYNPSSNSAVLNVSGGSGGTGTLNRLVVIRTSGTPAVAPTDGITYIPNLTFGTGITTSVTSTGNGNYVIKADNSTANFTVNNLAPNTTYYVEVYAYNQDTTPSTTAYLATPLSTTSFVTTAGTYVFTDLAPSNKKTWAEPTNWAPNRTYTSASSDILIFDGQATPTATLEIDFNKGQTPVTETIGQVKFINSVTINLFAPTTGNSAGVLQLAGTLPGDDFVIEANSSLILNSSSATTNRYSIINIASGATASIAGTLTFDSNNGPEPYRFLAVDAGAIQFLSGSTFNENAVVNYPFGTTGPATVFPSGTTLNDATNANTVVFNAGAKFNQLTGGDPFSPGPTATPGSNAVTTFAAGSFYKYLGGTFSTVGRTYGFLEFAGASTTNTVDGTLPLVVANSLTMTDGTVNLNETGTGTSIAANLTANGGTLNFVPATASVLTVGGTTQVGGATVAFTPTVTGTATFNGAVGVSSGSLTFNGAVANVNFKGNLTSNGTLTFSQTSASTVSFNGTALQTISGSGTISFGTATAPNALFEINNAAGLTLARPLTVLKGLALTLGLVNTTAANVLTLPATATITGGSSSTNTGIGGSFVNGPVARSTTAATGSLLFPVGKIATSGVTAGVKNYRPITLNTTAQTTSAGTAVTYTAEQIETPPTQPTKPNASGLDHVSFRRYFQVVPSPALTSYSGNVTLTFDTDDFVTFPAEPTFVIANRALPADWKNFGRGTSTGASNNGLPVAGTLTSGTFTSFAGSDFSLASTVPSVGFPGVNPLPVELTSFTATTKANGIALDWATASEKNSAYFEVQRSADSETFRTIAKVAAQGSSAAAQAYASLDRKPLAGRAYYRLHQVDLDGAESFSPVVTASWNAATVEAYPNPVSRTLFLGGVSGKVQFRILSVQGKALLVGQTTGATGVDVNALPAGIYLLETVTETGRSVQRFVRE